MAPPLTNPHAAFARIAEGSPVETARKAPVSNGTVRVTYVSAGDAPLMSSISRTSSTAAFSQRKVLSQSHLSQLLSHQPSYPVCHQPDNNLRVRSRDADTIASQLQFQQYLAQAQRAVAQRQQQPPQAIKNTPGDSHCGVGVRFSSTALVPVMIRVARHLEERMLDEHDPREAFQVPSVFDEPAKQQQHALTRLPAGWLDVVRWMHRIIDPLKLTPEITVYALILLERFFAASSLPFHGSNWRGIVLTAIIMAQKMQLDNSYHNFQVCFLCAPFNKYHLRAMELEFLGQISFDAYASIELYNSWAGRMLRTDASLPRPARTKLAIGKRQRLIAPGDAANSASPASSASLKPDSKLCGPPRSYLQKRKLSLHMRSRSNPQAMLLSMSSTSVTGVPPQQPGASVPRHARSTSTLPLAYVTDNDAAFESLSVHHAPAFDSCAVAAPKPMSFSRPVISIESTDTSLCSSLVSSPQSISSVPFSPSSVSVSSNDGSHVHVNSSLQFAPSNHLCPSASMYQLPTHVKSVSPLSTSQEAVAHYGFQQHQHHTALLAAAPTAAYAQYAVATAATTSGHVANSLNQHPSYSQVVPLTYPVATSGTASSSAAATAQYMRAVAAQQMAQLSALSSY